MDPRVQELVDRLAAAVAGAGNGLIPTRAADAAPLEDTMRTVTSYYLRKRSPSCIDEAQEEPLIITRYGRPVALMIGIEGYDQDDIRRIVSRALARDTGRRHQQSTRPAKDDRLRLLTRDE